MERLMPIDLERVALRRRVRGYDRKDVDALLLRASREIERLLVEQTVHLEEITRLRTKVEMYEGQEGSMRDALILAQKSADETRSNAHKEAELILDEARRRAADEQHLLLSKLSDLRWEMEKLKADRNRLVKEFRSFIDEARAMLDASSSEPVASALADISEHAAADV